MTIGPPSRRDMLGVGAMTVVAPTLIGRPATAQTFTGDDPRATAEGQVKLEATLDGSPAYWAYSGVIYAVQPAKQPRPILALAGGQSNRAVRRADGSYIIHGAILTFFRDVQSGAFLEDFDNPFTGRRNGVAPNVLTGGGVIYPADGSSAHAEGQFKSAVVAPQGFKAADPAKALGAVRWNVIGPSILLMTDRSWNVAVQPQLEAQTKIGDRTQFFDPRVRKMPAIFSASTIVPWMSWMDMGDTPGHLVWHSSGEKVFSVDDLPADYRAHAGSKLDLLTSRPT